jgi:glycosyl transferase, family 25
MEGQFDALGLSATRIEAVSTGDLTPEQLARHCETSARHHLRPPVAACTLSHLACWQALLGRSDDAEWALVLEDDAVLSKSVPTFLDAFGAESVTGVELVRLEGRPGAIYTLPARHRFASGHALVPFRSTLVGSAAYLISRRGASILAARDDLFHQPMDFALFRPVFGPGGAVRSVQVEPALCRQLDLTGSTSDSARGDIPLSSGGARRGALKRNYRPARILLDRLLHLPFGLRKREITLAGE